jgi:hypothetical protein
VTRLNTKNAMTAEYAEAKKVLDQYRRVKLLLDLVHRPDIEKLLEEASEASPILRKVSVRRVSRI